jgi:hypothetical protein
MQIKKTSRERRPSKTQCVPLKVVAEVPEIYQVVIECRHEREQQAVFERMRAEGYRCRVLTL